MENLDQEYKKPVCERVKIYHGISGTQRGGDAMSKLMNMIRLGVVYPSAENLENDKEIGVDSLSLAIFKHAFVHGKKTGKINIDSYLAKNSDDEELMSDPNISRYVNDEKYRQGVQRFGLNVVDIDRAIRLCVTWTDEIEQDTADTYGNEIYLEIVQDPKNVNKPVEESSVTTVVGPIDFKDVSKIVLSSKNASREEQIRVLLDEKGLNNIKIEIIK